MSNLIEIVGDGPPPGAFTTSTAEFAVDRKRDHSGHSFHDKRMRHRIIQIPWANSRIETHGMLDRIRVEHEERRVCSGMKIISFQHVQAKDHWHVGRVDDAAKDSGVRRSVQCKVGWIAIPDCVPGCKRCNRRAGQVKLMHRFVRNERLGIVLMRPCSPVLVAVGQIVRVKKTCGIRCIQYPLPYRSGKPGSYRTIGTRAPPLQTCSSQTDSRSRCCTQSRQ